MRTIEKVLILCPLAVTGGPEAMHQLAGILQQKGVEAWIMYYGGAQKGRILVNGRRIQASHSNAALTPEIYERYGAKVTDACELTESLCIVVPEVLQANLTSLEPAQVGLWWLSVDNALASNHGLRNSDNLTKWMKSIALHFTQSVYASSWLTANGQSEHWMLTDYTDPEFTKNPPVLAERVRRVLYNPRKGAHFVTQLKQQMSDWEFLPLQNFSKEQVQQLMQSSRYYVDFGHHPGKDRLPREAAASGCVVMTLKAGAAQFFADVPLDAIYKFSQAEIINGRLANTLQIMDVNYASHWHAQQRYRSRIGQEKVIFEAEVASIFGRE